MSSSHPEVNRQSVRDAHAAQIAAGVAPDCSVDEATRRAKDAKRALRARHEAICHELRPIVESIHARMVQLCREWMAMLVETERRFFREGGAGTYLPSGLVVGGFRGLANLERSLCIPATAVFSPSDCLRPLYHAPRGA